jgi:hypothetical protein
MIKKWLNMRIPPILVALLSISVVGVALGFNASVADGQGSNITETNQTSSLVLFKSANTSLGFTTSDKQLLEYKHPVLGLSMKYPATWNATEENPYSELNERNSLVSYDRITDNPDPDYGAGISLSSVDLSEKNMTLKAFVREQFEMDPLLQYMHRVGDSSGFISNIPVWKVEWQNENCCKGGPETGLVYFLIVGNKGYIVNYFGGVDYLKFFPEGSKIINSLRFSVR